MAFDIVRDDEAVSTLIVSGAHCLPCLARSTSLPADRVLAAFRRMENEWGQPLIDTARCATCRTTTTVYALRLP